MREVEEVNYTVVIIGDEKNRWACHYCGCPADTLDHIPPLTRFHDAMALDPKMKAVKVPSCMECNNLAGRELHLTFPDRAAFVKDKLATKYRKQLGQTDWEEWELEQMSYQFRVSIKKNLKAKLFVLSRSNFHPM